MLNFKKIRLECPNKTLINFFLGKMIKENLGELIQYVINHV